MEKLNHDWPVCAVLYRVIQMCLLRFGLDLLQSSHIFVSSRALYCGVAKPVKDPQD